MIFVDEDMMSTLVTKVYKIGLIIYLQKETKMIYCIVLKAFKKTIRKKK